MPKRKRRENEITCMCGAYDHPHRLSGGACTGSDWCAAFRSIDSYECEGCNHNESSTCSIITGQDNIDNDTCECIAREIRTRELEDTFGHLPLDIMSYYEKKHREYYEPEDE